jgi:ribonuclease D
MVRLPEPVDWVDTAPLLAAAAERWRRAPALGIDTEFVRERTFFPRLGLVQVSDGERCSLVDPLSLPDLSPLRDVLVDPGILKIAHSPSEDLEVLYHRFGDFPEPLFDTQAAAALAGREAALSYQRLVRELLGVELGKGETRTDWLRRPLSPEQLEYAAQDVELLLPLFRELEPRLRDNGRYDWVLAETRRLQDPHRFLPPPEDAWLRLGGLGSMDRRQLAVLRALASWREQQARERDLPRNFVLKEAAMVTLARRQPQRRAELADVPDLPPKQADRLADTLLHVIHEARQLPSEAMPPRPSRGARDERGKAVLDKLVEVVRRRAEAMGLEPPVLASRRELKLLLARGPSGEPPAALAGWRWELLAAEVLPILEQAQRDGVFG